jgi:hypothetical protein
LAVRLEEDKNGSNEAQGQRTILINGCKEPLLRQSLGLRQEQKLLATRSATKRTQAL